LRRFFANFPLLSNSVLTLITLAVLVPVLEISIRLAVPSIQNQEVQKVQSLLRPDPIVGYLWQPNLSEPAGTFKWADQVPQDLTTDGNGFFNDAKAISMAASGRRVDLLGLGDSFLHDAAKTFFSFFEQESLFYYSLAMHRHSPPQYNLILRDHAARYKPSWIIYGIYENDFDETEDFENWQRSGLDWFAFHSGTWAGRPLGGNLITRRLQAWLPELSRLFLRPLGMFGVNSMPKAVNAAKVAGYVSEARALAKSAGSRFLVVLIPSKETAVLGTPQVGPTYDQLVNHLKGEPNLMLVDLRKWFADCCDEQSRASLYYKIDGHWNQAGMREGARAILRVLRESGSPETPSHAVSQR
jgi:hypothetical protein